MRISRGIFAKGFAMSLASVAVVAVGQTNVQVIESTGTARPAARQESIEILIPGQRTGDVQMTTSTGATRTGASQAPIEILIPGQRAADVQMTTSTGLQPRRSGESIDVTPAQIRQRREQEALPVAPPPPMAPATTESPEPVSLDDNPTTAAVEPVFEPIDGAPYTAPDAAETTAPAPAGEAPPATDDAQSSPVEGLDFSGAKAASDSYLPPADLGSEDYVQRGDHKVPMLPGLLTSASLVVTVPDVYQTTLTNGMKFYHYEDRDLPRVRINLIVDAGAKADPADKIGLAALTADTIRTGGAGDLTGDQVDEALDQMASTINLGATPEFVGGEVFAVTDSISSATDLLAQMLMKPRLDEKKFESQKQLKLEKWRRRNDDPASASRREFRALAYGRDYPLARIETSATLGSISLDDVRRFYEDRYRPSTVWVGVSGDISQEDARKLIETAFAGWDRPAGERLAMPADLTETATSSGVYLTKRPTAQSQIRIGHLGIERKSPKAYAVNVLNSIYGSGGFSSRLMNTVRTKHGYVYGVGGGITSDDPRGLFAAIAASKGSTTVAAIREMLQVTKDIIESGVTEAEMETAKRDVIFSFASGFETASKIVEAHMTYDFRGYAEDYLKNFPENIRAVTAQQVQDVARELIQPEKLIIYVLGNPEELDGPLDEFGPVSEWPLQ